MYKVTSHTEQPWSRQTPESQWCDDSKQESVEDPEQFFKVELVDLGDSFLWWAFSSCKSAQGTDCSGDFQFADNSKLTELHGGGSTSSGKGSGVDGAFCSWSRTTESGVLTGGTLELVIQTDRLYKSLESYSDSCDQGSDELKCASRQIIRGEKID
jgi:hypothetical protein